MSNPLIVNTHSFGGIFPHKGEKCAKISSWRGVRWIPLKGREVILARQRHCSQGYVPVECLDPAFLVSLEAHQIWRGQVGEQKFVWKRDFPADGVKLVRDWRTVEHDGPNTYRFTVPKGTVIIPGDSGNPAQAGYHWEA